MSSTIDIVTDDRFTKLVADVVRKHFPDIHQYVPEILGLVRTKNNKDGDIVQGMSPPVVLKKTSPIYLACDVPAYLIVIDGAYWNQAPDHEIRGMIGNAIMSIEVQVTSNEKGEDVVRFKSRKPDLSIFTEAVRIFGAFTPAILKVREIAQGVATAALSFVKDETEEKEEEPAEEPVLRKKPRTRRAKKESPQQQEGDEWSEPPRVRSFQEIEDEEALTKSPA